jgi:hypothetical protein
MMDRSGNRFQGSFLRCLSESGSSLLLVKRKKRKFRIVPVPLNPISLSERWSTRCELRLPTRKERIGLLSLFQGRNGTRLPRELQSLLFIAIG